VKLKLALYGLFVLLVLSQIAATGQATALAIATVVGIIAPFVLRFIPLKDTQMVLLTQALSVVIAVVAGLISGDINLSNLGADPAAIVGLVGWTYAVTQAVYNYFKDHPLGPLVVH